MKYNEDYCVLEFSGKLDSITTSAQQIGVTGVVSGNLLPNVIPVTLNSAGTAIFFIREYDGAFMKKSLSGTLSNQSHYFQLIWKHNHVTS